MSQTQERVPYYAEGPLALVIGCGDMGLACARTLGRSLPLFIVDVDAERLQRSCGQLEREGYRAEGFRCDITDTDQIAALNAALEGKSVKVLAHVAAVAGAHVPWRRVIDVDLIGAHLIARMVTPLFVRGGVAIFISSTGAYRCPKDEMLDTLIDSPLQEGFSERLVQILGYEPDFLQAYFIAKQGLIRLAQHLALEWGPLEVRSLSLSPGLINSKMGRTSGSSLPMFDGGVERQVHSRSEMAKDIPLGRQGTLLEVAAVLDFLASDAASFVNGVDIPVDGGSIAKWRRTGAVAR